MNREAKGQPIGGQFAARDRADGDVTLNQPPVVHTRAIDVVYFAATSGPEIHADFTGRRHIAKLTAAQLQGRRLVVHGGSIRVTGRGDAQIEALGDTVVEASAGPKVIARGNAIVRAIATEIDAHDNARVDAGFGSLVRADGASHVEARDTTTVEASGEAVIVYDEVEYVHLSEAAAATRRRPTE